MQKNIFTAVIVVILAVAGQTKLAAQTTNLSIAGTASIGVPAPDATAVLDISSTGRLLIPRMTTAQKNAIATPALGLLVFQTDSVPGFYYFSGVQWQTLSSGGGTAWLLNGNGATNPAVNFIGTTDAQPLVFKVNNQMAGYLGHSATANTAFGLEALSAVSSGKNNTANGFRALYGDTSGYSNVAVGASAMYKTANGHNLVAVGDSAMFNTTTGSSNTAIGSKASYATSTGSNNTALGFRASYSNTTGSGNTAVGFKAAYSATKAGLNTAFGYYALYSDTSGYLNVALGANALYNNLTGHNLVAVGDSALFTTATTTTNTAVGSKALFSTTTGNDNTGVGYKTMYANTVGGQNTAIGFSALSVNTIGKLNAAVGYKSMPSVTGADNNTAIGAYSLNNDTTGASNVAAGVRAVYRNYSGNKLAGVGDSALFSNSTGSLNTALGSKALYTNTTGSNNTAVGALADVSISNLTNATALGYQASATASNMVRVGNSAVTSIGGFVNWSNISDGRFKKNIKQDVQGLAFIKKLQPVTYTLDITSINSFLHIPGQGSAAANPEAFNAAGGQAEQPAGAQDAVATKEKVTYSGFIAQDVEKAARDLGYDFSGVDAPKSKTDLYGLRYSDFVVPLVKAVQELSTQNDSVQANNRQLLKENRDLKNSVSTMQSQITSILQQLNDLKSAQEACCFNSLNSQPVKTTDGARLEQNAPNPFNNNTLIRYYLPLNTQAAQIMVTNVSGQVLKTVPLSGAGTGQIVIRAGELSSGNYFYTLLVDGKKIATKQMVLLQ